MTRLEVTRDAVDLLSNAIGTGSTMKRTGSAVRNPMNGCPPGATSHVEPDSHVADR